MTLHVLNVMVNVTIVKPKNAGKFQTTHLLDVNDVQIMIEMVPVNMYAIPTTLHLQSQQATKMIAVLASWIIRGLVVNTGQNVRFEILSECTYLKIGIDSWRKV